MMTVTKHKNLSEERNVLKRGIAVTSSKCRNIGSPNGEKHVEEYRNKKIKMKNNEINHKSLEKERARYKKEKQEEKRSQIKHQQTREEMETNINKLEIHYDQIKLKRSEISIKETERSQQKTFLNVQFTQSDSKNVVLLNTAKLINKCVPKSKINLNDLLNSSANQRELDNSLTKKSLSKKQSEECLNFSSSVNGSGYRIEKNSNLKMRLSECDSFYSNKSLSGEIDYCSKLTKNTQNYNNNQSLSKRSKFNNIKKKAFMEEAATNSEILIVEITRVLVYTSANNEKDKEKEMPNPYFFDLPFKANLDFDILCMHKSNLSEIFCLFVNKRNLFKK